MRLVSAHLFIRRFVFGAHFVCIFKNDTSDQLSLQGLGYIVHIWLSVTVFSLAAWLISVALVPHFFRAMNSIDLAPVVIVVAGCWLRFINSVSAPRAPCCICQWVWVHLFDRTHWFLKHARQFSGENCIQVNEYARKIKGTDTWVAEYALCSLYFTALLCSTVQCDCVSEFICSRSLAREMHSSLPGFCFLHIYIYCWTVNDRLLASLADHIKASL